MSRKAHGKKKTGENRRYNGWQVVFARRQSKPAQKITENGGAIKKNTFCTLTNSGTPGVRLMYHAIIEPAASTIVPAIWPKRTC